MLLQHSSLQMSPAKLKQQRHGCVVLCRVASQVGAFINLESTGPGGPDILFQASGQLWMLCWCFRVACASAYACACALVSINTATNAQRM